MQKYSTYKSTGVEWLGDVPTHWNVDTLKNHCEIFASGVDKKIEEGEIEVLLCNYVDVYKNFQIDSSIDFMKATATQGEIEKFSLQLNDIVLTKDSETPDDIAVPAIVKEVFENFLCGYHLSIIRCVRKIEPDFLIWILRDLNIATQFHREAIGITRYGLASKHFKNGIITFPVKQEQRAIANYLDVATKKIDSVIATKQQQVEKLEQYKKSKIHECVTKGLEANVKLKPSGVEWIGDFPENWRVEKLKYLTSLIIDGTHFTPEYIDDETGVVFLRVTDVQDEEIDLSRVRRISSVEHFEINKRCNPEIGDLLLSKNGTIGITKIVNWEFPCSLFVSLCLIKPLKKLNVRFLDHLFKGGFFDLQLSDGSKATTVTNLHLEKIREFKLLRPSLKEQEQIASFLDKFCYNILKEKIIIEQQIEKLKLYRKCLIHECVTGKRKVTE